MKKTTDQVYGILEDMATNSNQWPRDKTIPRKAVAGADIEVMSNLVNHVAQTVTKAARCCKCYSS